MNQSELFLIIFFSVACCTFNLSVVWFVSLLEQAMSREEIKSVTTHNFFTHLLQKKNHSNNFQAKIQIFFFIFSSSSFTWSTWMIRRKKKSLVIRKISFLFSSLYLKCLSFEPAKCGMCGVHVYNQVNGS